MRKIRGDARCFFVAATSLVSIAAAPAWGAEQTDEIVITGRQLPPLFTEQVFAVTTIDRSALESAPQNRLDDALRSVPGFSLFRRQSSRASHPTTQGVTLRGLGPSGAGRTLVLLDGVPQNDPFGGWVDWSRLPTIGIDGVAITRGGGAGPWGNAALAGVIRLSSRTPQFFEGEARAQSDGGYEGSAVVRVPIAAATIRGLANWHETPGAYLLHPDHRGLVDIPAESLGGIVALDTSFLMESGTRVSFGGSYSRDRFVNGLEIALAKSRITDANVSAVHDGGDDAVSWEVHAYVRDQHFQSIFTAVNATRTTVTPSLDQFSVPAKAVGGNAIVRVPLADALTIETGADIRRTEGVTNERLTFVNNAPTRQRRAGGEQLTGGVFAELNWALDPSVVLNVGVRGDYWEQTNGSRLETAIGANSVFIDQKFPQRDGMIANYRAGVHWDATEAFSLRAVTYSGFRAPTLNELYRPFRVGNDITEANPDLDLERLFGIELGASYQLERGWVSGGYFYNRLRNGAGNVTIQTTPGQNVQFNIFVPAGGTLRQRQNIGEIESSGFETEIGIKVLDSLTAELRYLYANPKITKSANEPLLLDKRLAQVSRHQGSLGLTWRQSALTLKADTRAVSGSFEDDQNLRPLKAYLAVDLYAGLKVWENGEVFLNVENAFDKTIEAGRSADGRITIGPSRTVGGGVRFQF